MKVEGKALEADLVVIGGGGAGLSAAAAAGEKGVHLACPGWWRCRYAFGYAVNSGRIAGENAAQFALAN